MRIQELGHVVVKVRDVQRAEHFYSKTLGIPIGGRMAHPVPMVFFTLGHHHDFAVMELGRNGPSPDRNTAGLAHVAFKVGDSLDEFDVTKRELEAAGTVILFELHHAHTKGMHIHDPDGNEVELFVDIPPAGRSRLAKLVEQLAQLRTKHLGIRAGLTKLHQRGALRDTLRRCTRPVST